MIFLNSLFLMGLAAAAIPLIIHLFNFRKPRRVEFSSLTFLHELEKSTMQRVRIKQWLLLALRMLAIAALVFSFARPTLTGDYVGSLGGHGLSSMVVVLDNSASMELRDGSGAYIEQARTIGAALIDEMQSGDEVFVLPTISSQTTVAAFQNREGAISALLGVEVAPGRMRLTASLRRAADLLVSSANPNREIFVLSDLQASTLVDSIDADIQDNIQIFLIPIGERDHDNIAITELQVLSRILSVGQVVRMEATLANYGKRSVSNLVVSVFLGGERVGQATVDLSAEEIVNLPLAVTPRSTGWLKGRVEIQDAEYSSDDSRAFTLFIPEERNLLIVGGRSARTEYLELALSEDLTDSGVRFSVDRIDETGLAGISLGPYDAVILAGVADLSSGERAAIVQYTQAGGGLLVFPGNDMVLEDYNALFTDLGAGQIEGVAESADSGALVAGFEGLDAEHPLFEGMFEISGDGRPPVLEQPDIRRMILYRPGSGFDQMLIRTSGDRSFLQEVRSGLGSMLLYAVAPEESWGDFPVRGLFVPLLYRSIYYLSAGGSVTGEEFIAGEAAQLRLTGQPEGTVIELVSETGDSYTPELRRVPGAILASVEMGFLRPGIYDVNQAGSLIRRLVVHPVPEESVLDTYLPDEALESISAAVGKKVFRLDLKNSERAELIARLNTARSGLELWNVFLMLALVTLLAEMLIEKKWRPEAA